DLNSLRVELDILENNYEADRARLEEDIERLETKFGQERLQLESEEGDILDEIRALGGDE
ncbi:hypothetical protein, partial [Arcanobacterium phocae]|uniref:hypothetical protein n=1 Tax=Arcanobacterium phocae TaxID=131112 RepID=UPI001C1188C5